MSSLLWIMLQLALGWRHLCKNKRQNAWRMKQDFHMAGPLHYPNLSFFSPWNSLCWGFTRLPSVPTAEFSSVQSCLTLCNPMDYSMPGFTDHHQLPELAQNHVHQVGDAIQSSSVIILFLFSVIPFSSCLNLFQNQGLFQWVSSLHQVAKVLSVSISPSSEYSGLI